MASFISFTSLPWAEWGGLGVLLTGCDPELPLSAFLSLCREDLGKGPAQEVGGE